MKTLTLQQAIALLPVTENIILNADSYKISHWMFLEDNTEFSTSYVEARVGAKYEETVFFGLQYILMQDTFMKPVTADMVDQAEVILTAHGEPFNRAGWDYIVNRHNGYLPIRIKAVREGTPVPVNNALVVVESTDPKFNSAWGASFVETKLMRLWYPTTIATQSREMKKIIHASLERTGDPTQADMKMVDFGSRGVTCFEQSMIGGAHLVSFQVTDNLPGVAMMMQYYGSDGDELPGYSIPATEHSVTCSWGKKHEFDFYANIVRNVLPKTGICSVVMDTYDLLEAIDMMGTMRTEIEQNGVIVFRPDSGDPIEMTELVVRKLDAIFGSEVNEKGFKVLNPCARIIQGDGIDIAMTKAILDNFERIGYSADNITFGSGGGLLQKVNRDTMRFAMKASNVIVDGEERDIRKTVVTDPTKSSKAGILTLIRNDNTGEFRTVNQHDELVEGDVDMLEPVYDTGTILRMQTWKEIRELAAVA
jgi:nicotinamide phosphoribosyltransferase